MNMCWLISMNLMRYSYEKNLERLLLQLRSIVINTGSVRVQVPLGKLAIPPLQPIRISMEESKSEETVRGSSLHE